MPPNSSRVTSVVRAPSAGGAERGDDTGRPGADHDHVRHRKFSWRVRGAVLSRGRGRARQATRGSGEQLAGARRRAQLGLLGRDRGLGSGRRRPRARTQPRARRSFGVPHAQFVEPGSGSGAPPQRLLARACYSLGCGRAAPRRIGSSELMRLAAAGGRSRPRRDPTAFRPQRDGPGPARTGARDDCRARTTCERGAARSAPATCGRAGSPAAPPATARHQGIGHDLVEQLFSGSDLTLCRAERRQCPERLEIRPRCSAPRRITSAWSACPTACRIAARSVATTAPSIPCAAASCRSVSASVKRWKDASVLARAKSVTPSAGDCAQVLRQSLQPAPHPRSGPSTCPRSRSSSTRSTWALAARQPPSASSPDRSICACRFPSAITAVCRAGLVRQETKRWQHGGHCLGWVQVRRLWCRRIRFRRRKVRERARRAHRRLINTVTDSRTVAGIDQRGQIGVHTVVVEPSTTAGLMGFTVEEPARSRSSRPPRTASRRRPP